ncbi:hypothetical protein OA88_23005 [Flavobacterium sp. JRM]|nr:hypothetical protein OA88_23005 [Flavobacterium sp. JRM]
MVLVKLFPLSCSHPGDDPVNDDPLCPGQALHHCINHVPAHPHLGLPILVDGGQVALHNSLSKIAHALISHFGVRVVGAQGLDVSLALLVHFHQLVKPVEETRLFSSGGQDGSVAFWENLVMDAPRVYDNDAGAFAWILLCQCCVQLDHAAETQRSGSLNLCSARQDQSAVVIVCVCTLAIGCQQSKVLNFAGASDALLWLVRHKDVASLFVQI